MNTSIWWIRRDLRLSDNQALTAALGQSETVIPTFILDPDLLRSPFCSQKRLAFLFAGLRALDADLRKRGSRLIIREGTPVDALRSLYNETGAVQVFAEADLSPYARRRDAAVMQQLPLTLTQGITIHPVEYLRKPDGTPYKVFTPFHRMWRSLPLGGTTLPAPAQLPALPDLSSQPIPDTPTHPLDSPFPAGETEALARLDAFIHSAIDAYHLQRNRLDLEGTSRLSPYLRFGMISARQAALAAGAAEINAGKGPTGTGPGSWLNELIWREFYAAILYHFPQVRKTGFRAATRALVWRDAPEDFAAWSAGRTGYPVVDAAMRQLNATGWMHNRARMIAASFLTKDLLIDWRLGERYFMQNLIDGDPAANNGGWQWVAGTGADAAPFFRVFNPVLQGMKFDPQGKYIRRWVPELASVSDEYIHIPWEMPDDLQHRTGVRVGKDYPFPRVDHSFARARALAVYGLR